MIKDLNSYISDPDSLDRDRIAELLALEDFSSVYREADRVRREAVGDTGPYQSYHRIFQYLQQAVHLLRAELQEQ